MTDAMNTPIATASPVLLLAVLFFISGPAPVAGSEEAIKIYERNRCFRCHSVQVAGLEVIEAEDEDDEDDELLLEDVDRPDPPDLSGVGLKHDASFLRGYLMRREEIEGREHRRRFRGHRTELATLVDWLVTLKSPVEEETEECTDSGPGD